MVGLSIKALAQGRWGGGLADSASSLRDMVDAIDDEENMLSQP